MEFYTIGVYNSTEYDFFGKLTQNKIDTFCDIRQRRGVRGTKYSFVNSNRLQERLHELGIRYGHILELAPTAEIRGIQNEVDIAKGELKSKRQELGEAFVIEYKKHILNNFDFGNFFEKLEEMGAHRVVLFCVEESASACHRSIVAEKLTNTYGYKITHL